MSLSEMSAARNTCVCGHESPTATELADHLAEVFIPDDDRAADGQVHAEVVRPEPDGTVWECLCGFATVERASFDAHLMAVFTPADQVGRDGRRHAPVSG